MESRNHIVIMAGGIGSRLWPVSTPDHPKQFIDILGTGYSLIQMTARRFTNIAPIQNFWVVTGERYVETVRRQLPQIPENHILAEPVGRNTAPCIAYACRKISKVAPDANIVVTPSDAFVGDNRKFETVIKKALSATEGSGRIVTIGIKPTRAETGYGYICAESLEQETIVKVSEFKEKPDSDTAKSYLAAGNFFWNAGIFVWSASTINSQIALFAPQISGVMDLIEPYLFTHQESEALQKYFPQCEKISIDYAVMEKSKDIFVISCDPNWSDLGTWIAVKEHIKTDENGNCVVGDARLYECKGCIVHVPDGSQVVLQGLVDSVAALNEGRLLVCKLSENQNIKELCDF